MRSQITIIFCSALASIIRNAIIKFTVCSHNYLGNNKNNNNNNSNNKTHLFSWCLREMRIKLSIWTSKPLPQHS